jgi:peptidoglycan lytic transglycosylase D
MNNRMYAGNFPYRIICCREIVGHIFRLRCVAIVLMICVSLVLLAITVNEANALEFQSIAYAHKNHQLFLANHARQSNDIWLRIRNGFALKDFDSKEVHNHEISYTRHPKYIHRMIERSKPYLYHIVEEVERRSMPTEIVLLPLVESAFDPKAKSKSNALGLWQFIPSTGESYGLMQNKWYDDRKDIIAATGAALDYLQKLHTIFGDWKLAVAAYNWGKNAVRRSIAKNHEAGRPTSFHHIKLPPETSNHVYKLIAVRNIIAAPEKFGVKLAVIPNQPYFAKVKISYPVNISHVAQLADISIDEFKALNPAYKLGIIKIDDAPRIVLLPIEKKEIFLKNFEIYSKLFRLPQISQLKEDGGVDEITRSQEIILMHLDVINDITKNKKSITKRAIPVPQRKRSIGADIKLAKKKPLVTRMLGQSKNKGMENAFTYIVKKGDTLYAIARQHGLTVAQIKYWNNGDEHLSIGQELMLLPNTSTALH